MTLKDMFNLSLTYPKVRAVFLEANPEIPKQTKRPGEWLQKHDPAKYMKYYRHFIEG